MAEAFIDRPKACRCRYCSTPRLKAFIDGGLLAAREQGLPRPQVKTVALYITENPDLPSPHLTSVHTWLKHCRAWTDPWPGEPDG